VRRVFLVRVSLEELPISPEVEQTRHVPGDLYARKQRRPEDHGQSFANFGYLASGIEMASPESRLRDHAARWEALSEAARRYFRAHAPDDEPDDP
jgi:hypothetical protein